jgi:hypothetical protein
MLTAASTRFTLSSLPGQLPLTLAQVWSTPRALGAGCFFLFGWRADPRAGSGQGKTVYLLGVSLDPEKRNIDHYVFEQIA